METPQATGQVKKITLRDKKKAQPLAKLFFSEDEKRVIIETVARKLSVSQVKIFFYNCQALGLNPMLNEICAVSYSDKNGNKTLSIQVMRDGFLTIAHRSGKFAGLESGVKTDDDGKILFGWAKVYHKDFSQPVYQEADFSEYNCPEKGGKKTLWYSKPKTMIKKVAESMALRKAFNVSGVYAAEEMDNEIEVAGELATPSVEIVGGDKPATEIQIKSIKALMKAKGIDEEIKDGLTRQEAAEVLKKIGSMRAKKG